MNRNRFKAFLLLIGSAVPLYLPLMGQLLPLDTDRPRYTHQTTYRRYLQQFTKYQRQHEKRLRSRGFIAPGSLPVSPIDQLRIS